MKRFLNTILTTVKVLVLLSIWVGSVALSIAALQKHLYNDPTQLLGALITGFVVGLPVMHELLKMHDKSEGRKPMGLKNLL